MAEYGVWFLTVNRSCHRIPIIMQSAETIAHPGQPFGQDDDITIVTLKRLLQT